MNGNRIVFRVLENRLVLAIPIFKSPVLGISGECDLYSLSDERSRPDEIENAVDMHPMDYETGFRPSRIRPLTAGCKLDYE